MPRKPLRALHGDALGGRGSDRLGERTELLCAIHGLDKLVCFPSGFPGGADEHPLVSYLRTADPT